IDLIIGTHSLLSDRIELKTPGLIVIDEEQKFGVKHKEKIKALRLNAHTLSMTATPIPRTLHMSLSGIRDISVIATPPPGRKPIINKSHIFNWDIVQQAIAKEMVRDGQVYYLHNRVATIDKTALKIQELFPQKRVDVVHGRMAASHLASVMQRFARKEIDILVCTTIVENGLDLANVNTLIIDDVEKLGLAQMYQIRGRIGRGERQAYAYFLYKKLRGDSRLRLEAIEEFEELGSGFLLASRDLEIRGAGSILGKEQSGRIHAVGYSLYMKMLRESVEKLKDKGSNEGTSRSVKHGAGFTGGGWIR
ncbi:transcription-repair coupling factor, partial [Candidatus Dojkabacteria bacterium]|nr:transcription-repair coupling factor [Candidatus Dojkabacteria bacterium]